MTTDRIGQETTTFTVVVYVRDTGIIEKVVRTDNPDWIDVQVDDPDIEDKVVLEEDEPLIEKDSHYVDIGSKTVVSRPESTLSINKAFMSPGEEVTVSNLPWGTKAEVRRRIGGLLVDLLIYDQHNEGVITDGFLTLSSQEECILQIKIVPPWPERGVEYEVEISGPFVP